MIRILLIITFLLSYVFCVAQDSIPQPKQRLVIWQKNGLKEYFDLDEESQISFHLGQLLISTSKTKVGFPLAGILRYTYEGVKATGAKPKLNPGEINFSQMRNKMSFDGLPEGTLIEVKDAKGKMVRRQTSEKDKTAVVSFESLPKGKYTISMNNRVYTYENQ